MRATLDIDDEVLEAAAKAAPGPTKTELKNQAL